MNLYSRHVRLEKWAYYYYNTLSFSYYDFCNYCKLKWTNIFLSKIFKKSFFIKEKKLKNCFFQFFKNKLDSYTGLLDNKLLPEKHSWLYIDNHAHFSHTLTRKNRLEITLISENITKIFRCLRRWQLFDAFFC